jgi:outer membrane biosynthesis protein TonB
MFNGLEVDELDVFKAPADAEPAANFVDEPAAANFVDEPAAANFVDEPAAANFVDEPATKSDTSSGKPITKKKTKKSAAVPAANSVDVPVAVPAAEPAGGSDTSSVKSDTVDVPAFTGNVVGTTVQAAAKATVSFNQFFSGLFRLALMKWLFSTAKNAAAAVGYFKIQVMVNETPVITTSYTVHIDEQTSAVISLEQLLTFIPNMQVLGHMNLISNVFVVELLEHSYVAEWVAQLKQIVGLYTGDGVAEAKRYINTLVLYVFGEVSDNEGIIGMLRMHRFEFYEQLVFLRLIHQQLSTSEHCAAAREGFMEGLAEKVGADVNVPSTASVTMPAVAMPAVAMPAVAMPAVAMPAVAMPANAPATESKPTDSVPVTETKTKTKSKPVDAPKPVADQKPVNAPKPKPTDSVPVNAPKPTDPVPVDDHVSATVKKLAEAAIVRIHQGDYSR